jgi:hypothetical protein
MPAETPDAMDDLRKSGRPHGAVIARFALVYSVFAVAFIAVEYAYCSYRAAAGNPSDLPCLSALWTPMVFACWPMFVLDMILQGQAVLVPSLWVRTVGVLFAGGFVAALGWVARAGRVEKG